MGNSTDFAGKNSIVSLHAVGQARARAAGLAGAETPKVLSLLDDVVGQNWTTRWDVLDQGGERQLVPMLNRGCWLICKANARFIEDSRPVVLTVLTQSMVDKNFHDGRFVTVLKHSRQIGDIALLAREQAKREQVRKQKFTVLWTDKGGNAQYLTTKKEEVAQAKKLEYEAQGCTDVEIKSYGSH